MWQATELCEFAPEDDRTTAKVSGEPPRGSCDVGTVTARARAMGPPASSCCLLSCVNYWKMQLKMPACAVQDRFLEVLCRFWSCGGPRPPIPDSSALAGHAVQRDLGALTVHVGDAYNYLEVRQEPLTRCPQTGVGAAAAKADARRATRGCDHARGSMTKQRPANSGRPR